MARLVSTDNSKKIPNVKTPRSFAFPNITNILNPFESPWKQSPYQKKNWFKKSHTAQVNNIKLPAPGEGLPRVLHYCADQGGCAFWRMIFPGNELLANNKAVVQTLYQMVLDPHFYNGIDAIELQRQCSDTQFEFIKHLRNISNELKKNGKKGFKIIYSVDDVVLPAEDIMDFNLCKKAFTDPKIHENVKEMMKYVDEMVVQSVFLKNHYQKHLEFDKISVIPNYVPRYWFDKGTSTESSMTKFIKNKDKPRILYAGSSTHFDIANINGQRDDFTHVVDHIIHDLEVTKKYQWVFVGGIPNKLRKYVENNSIEYHSWTSMTEYPKLLNSTNANVMIAPLAVNNFNKAKANIKLTEAAAIHIPCVAQNIECYNSDGWKYLFNTGEEMMAMIDKIVESEESYIVTVKDAEEYVNKYWLGDHLDQWVNLYTTEFGDEKRKESENFLQNNQEQFNKTKTRKKLILRAPNLL